MWDGIELWLRRAGAPLLVGVVMMAQGVGRRLWLPWRVGVFFFGVAAVVACGVETWRLIRSEESTKVALDRLEAAERGESPE
ncbi:hypothetical protein ABZY68_11325 [Streptomyces sp. NPDC006482]|uniref:hypothetical protein n=1 Tax=Streptomyces sp. NPDC006482 TaxID=3154306 RepID=UPI0033A63492